MRWTYQEYRRQPRWFIDILQMTFRQDADKQAEDDAAEAAKRKSEEAKLRAKGRK